MLAEEWGDCIARERRAQLLTKVFGPAFKQGGCSAGEFRRGGSSELSVTRAPSPRRPPTQSASPPRDLRVRRSRRQGASPGAVTTAQAPAETAAREPPGGPPTLPVALPIGRAPPAPVLKRKRLDNLPTPNPAQRAQRAPSVSPPPRRVSFTAEALAKPPKVVGKVGCLRHPDPERRSRPESQDPTPHEVDGIIVSPGGGRLVW